MKPDTEKTPQQPVAYEPPRLVSLGSVSELTHGIDLGGTPDIRYSI
jgi:hypothetical protein